MSDPNLRVVNLAGHRGSGKTTAARYLGEYYGFSRLQPEMLCSTDKSYLDTVPDSIHTLGQRLEQSLPELPRYFEQATGRMCIDGLLFPAVAQKLQDCLGDRYATLALDCHVELRAWRLGISSHALYYEDEPYNGALLLDAGSVMDMAQEHGAMIDTNRPRQSVCQQLDAALGRLGMQ